MSIALIGHANDRPDDPMILIAPTLLDQRVMDPTLARDKERLEDLQLWSCLSSLAWAGHLTHPLTLGPGADPPDRVITCDARTYAVELTELTVQDIRADLARARQVGRAVQQAVDQDPLAFAHLRGRLVSLTRMPDTPMGNDPRPIVESIAAGLTYDLGTVGEGVDVSDGFPQQWPNARGFYGELAPGFVGVVHGQDRPDAPPIISASAQGQIFLSDARAALYGRIAAKDDPRNQVLIVTTGRIDPAGYICPLDLWLYQVLLEHGLGVVPEPQHLDVVILHDYTSGQFMIVYMRPGTPLPL